MWHEARRSERKVHDLMDAARKRAQRRAIYLAKRRGDPQQSLQVVGSRCRVHRDDGLYQATQDQQGLIPWNGKEDILIDRFDGRALLDFIRDSGSRAFRAQQKTGEEEEVEEFVNFERYRDLIKHRRRGCRYFLVLDSMTVYRDFHFLFLFHPIWWGDCKNKKQNKNKNFLLNYGKYIHSKNCLLTVTDEEGLQHVHQELEAKSVISLNFERPHSSQPPVNKGSYSQVGFSYNGDSNEDSQNVDADDEDEDDEDEDDDDDEKDFSSDDSNDERMETIAKEFGVKRYNWLVYMDKKAKEEEKRQKEIIKGDPAIRKLSRKERRKASQMEREREREAARSVGRATHHDPYREQRRSPTYEAYPRSRRSRSRSRSRTPARSRRHDYGSHADNGYRSKSKPPKIEYITEFAVSIDNDDPKMEAISPPSSPVQADPLNRPSGGRILEALHTDPASSLSLEQEKSIKLSKPSISSSSALAKLRQTATGGSAKTPQSEKKETPQERLKRIMSKQLNKQIKKDTAAELAKKREQERQRQEKLAETSRLSRYSRRSYSRSPSRSPPRRRRHSRSRSRSRTPPRYRSRSRSHSHSRSRSRSPRYRSRSRY